MKYKNRKQSKNIEDRTSGTVNLAHLIGKDLYAGINQPIYLHTDSNAKVFKVIRKGAKYGKFKRLYLDWTQKKTLPRVWIILELNGIDVCFPFKAGANQIDSAKTKGIKDIETMEEQNKRERDWVNKKPIEPIIETVRETVKNSKEKFVLIGFGILAAIIIVKSNS